MNTNTSKRNSLHHFLKIALIFIIAHFGNPTYANSTDELAYRRAINQAHNADYSSALTTLKYLSNKHPKPNRYFYDYISILGWSGKNQLIVKHTDSISLQQAPKYVLNTLAIAHRQQLNFIVAERIYRVMGKRFPTFIDGKIGLGLVLTDQRKFISAHLLLLSLQKNHPNNLSLLKALIYFHESQENYVAALRVYQHILNIYPKDKEALRGKILVLNRMGAAHLANSLIDNPKDLNNEDIARIKTSMSAHQIRWSGIPQENEKNRFNEIERTITGLERNIEDFKSQFGDTSSYTLNAQFDLLVALRERYRMKDTLKLYDQLLHSDIEIPTYALIAVCDAYLYLERADEAESCYLSAKENISEENINLDLALFYAYVENEKMDIAQSWIKQVARRQPLYIKGKGEKPFKRPNPKKVYAETTSILSIAYTDNLKSAERKIKALHQLAPYNPEIRKELANIYYWRGWPRKAQEEYDIGLNQEPKHRGLLIGNARNQFALKHYNQAEDSISTLHKSFPEDKGITKLNKLWGIHNMREFKTDISTSNSSGGVNGSRGVDISSYLYSRPLNKNYRTFIHHRHSQAKFVEGDGLLNLAGIGLEYKAPDIILMTEIHHNHYDDDRIGINFSGTYEIDDHMSSSISLESLSKQTPLRALNQGIYAKSISWGGQYRWHESRSAGFNLNYLIFSEDNERKSINGYWLERWYNQYDYKFSTRIDLYSSRNSKSNTIYFNPENDFAGVISFENEWLSWREYEDSFHQRIILSSGFYNQNNYKSGDTWGLQYEHRWSTNYRQELIYGIKRSSNLYDGNDELSWSYYLSLNWRF